MSSEDIRKKFAPVLNTQRVAINVARRNLAADLAKYGGTAEIADALLLEAEEYGPENTLPKLAEQPVSFGLTKISDKDFKRITGDISSYLEANDKMDDAVTARENELRVDQPNKLPVFQIFGREFELDGDARTMRYLDTGEVLKNAIHEVKRKPLKAPEKTQSEKSKTENERER